MRGSIAGLPEFSLKGEDPCHYAFLSVLDVLFSAFVVAPAVVSYWRVVWQLMIVYVYPSDILISSLISTAIGCVGHLFFMISKNFFNRTFSPDKNRIVFFLVSRLYTGCYGIVCVNGWRGPWNLLDLYISMDFPTTAITTLVAVLALIALKTLRNIVAAPFNITRDETKGYFDVETTFKTSLEEKTSWYVLDCLFSVVVVGTLVVFVWRGAWVLLDLYLFPESEVWSSWGSLVLGYGIVGIAFLLQPLMRWICDRIHGVARLIVADIFLLFAFVGTINVWRGIWNLLNIYFLSENLELSCWITHWVCLILLILLKCSNSLLVRGVYIDAEEPAGKCVVFPVYYLRLIFQHERAKKITKNLQLDSIIRGELDNANTKSCVCTIEANHIPTTKEILQKNPESNHHPAV